VCAVRCLEKSQARCVSEQKRTDLLEKEEVHRDNLMISFLARPKQTAQTLF